MSDFITEGKVKEVIGLGGRLRIRIEPVESFAIKRKEKTYAVWYETSPTAPPTFGAHVVESDLEYEVGALMKELPNPVTALHKCQVRLHADRFLKTTGVVITSIDIIG